jgi:hypothetical protein
MNAIEAMMKMKEMIRSDPSFGVSHIEIGEETLRMWEEEGKLQRNVGDLYSAFAMPVKVIPGAYGLRIVEREGKER